MKLFRFLKKKETINPAAQAITGNFNMTATLGASGRTMQMAGYIYDGESQESVMGRVDIFRAILEREKTFAEIPELEAKREQIVKAMMQARDVLSDFESRQKNGTNLSSQERMNMRNLATNIEKMKEELDKGSAAIRDAKVRVGMPVAEKRVGAG